jgi:hypothetical protein
MYVWDNTIVYSMYAITSPENLDAKVEKKKEEVV